MSNKAGVLKQCRESHQHAAEVAARRGAEKRCFWSGGAGRVESKKGVVFGRAGGGEGTVNSGEG